MRITLGGEQWTRRIVGFLKEAYGDCDRATRVIRIVRNQETARKALDTEIHEALHAQMDWLDEDYVAQFATELTTLLFDKLKYRRSET